MEISCPVPDTESPQWLHLLSIMDRMERKLEGLLAHDIEHANEIRSIKEDLREAKTTLDSRLSPVEQFVNNWATASRFIKYVIGALVTLGAVITAISVIKEKLW